MNRSQTAALLAMCAAYDQRTIGETDVAAWHAALDDINAEDARRAVIGHYREQTQRIMPADIRRGVRRVRDARLTAASPAQPPPGLDPDDVASYRRWLADERRRTASGSVSAELAAS